MDTLILKEEWAVKCKNCGCDSHCGKECRRKENHHPIDGYFEYEIEVCKQCRCDACVV